MDRKQFKQLVKGVREMKRHITGRPVHRAQKTKAHLVRHKVLPSSPIVVERPKEQGGRIFWRNSVDPRIPA